RVHAPFGPGLEGAGHGADAAFLARWQQRAQQVGEVVGVSEPERIAPVGLVGVLLHGAAVERAVRKAVEREDVVAALGEEALELGERRGVAQALGGLVPEAQPDGEGSAFPSSPASTPTQTRRSTRPASTSTSGSASFADTASRSAPRTPSAWTRESSTWPPTPAA